MNVCAYLHYKNKLKPAPLRLSYFSELHLSKSLLLTKILCDHCINWKSSQISIMGLFLTEAGDDKQLTIYSQLEKHLIIGLV